MESKKVRLETHLDPELVDWLRQEAKLHVVSISEVVRQSLRRSMGEIGTLTDNKETRTSRRVALVREIASIDAIDRPNAPQQQDDPEDL